jgi:hypothetical protein
MRDETSAWLTLAGVGVLLVSLAVAGKTKEARYGVREPTRASKGLMNAVGWSGVILLGFTTVLLLAGAVTALNRGATEAAVWLGAVGLGCLPFLVWTIRYQRNQ